MCHLELTTWKSARDVSITVSVFGLKIHYLSCVCIGLPLFLENLELEMPQNLTAVREMLGGILQDKLPVAHFLSLWLHQ